MPKTRRKRRPPTIDVVSQSPAQLVLRWRARGKSAETTGWMSGIFIGVGGFVALLATADHTDDLTRLETTEATMAVGGALAVLGGLVFAVLWLRLRFGAATLFLSRGELRLRQTLFGWSSTKHATLPPDAVASVVVHHHDNDKPVQCVALPTSRGELRFGLGLLNPDVKVLSERINQFLSR